MKTALVLLTVWANSGAISEMRLPPEQCAVIAAADLAMPERDRPYSIVRAECAPLHPEPVALLTAKN
jgi:hypothetical protein